MFGHEAYDDRGTDGRPNKHSNPRARAQSSFGGKIAEVRDGTMLISQSASCATFPSICHNHMRPNRSVNPEKRGSPGDASRFEEEMSSMNLSESPDREIQFTISVASR